MNKLTYSIFCLISAFLFTAVSIPAFAGGAGGSWGEDGFTGNGGGFGGSGGGGSWDGTCPDAGWTRPTNIINGQFFATPEAACQAIASSLNQTFDYFRPSSPTSGLCKMKYDQWSINKTGDCLPPPPPDCPPDMHWDGSNCVKDLKCPAGYKKEGNKCIWECPAGMKLVGGNCVKDTQPVDCDPAIQQCDEDGKPKCNVCEKLNNIINNQSTNINNDNRIISLSETNVMLTNSVSNTVNNVNNTVNNINNTVNNITTKIDTLIETINNNAPEFDTTSIENKLDELLNRSVDPSAPSDIDLTPVLEKMDQMILQIDEGLLNDIQLQAKIDELINKELDFSEITDRQDEQTGLLEDIKRLLMPTNEAGDPSFEVPEVETPQTTDLWGAIRGFDIHQNRINASKHCPADKEFTISLLTVTKTFAIPMAPMCEYLSYLAPIFLMLAYFSGAMIILKVGD